MKLWNHNVFSVSLFGFIMGASQFWSSPVLPKLTGGISGEGSLFQAPITALQASIITSYLNLGSIFGPILASLLNDRIGRRKTSLLCSIILTISYLVSAFAPTIETLYGTRFIIGIINGCLLVVAPIYSSEIAENYNRGAVMSFVGVMYNVGSLVCLTVGPFVSVRVITLICGFPMLIASISFAFFTAESPYYLLAKAKEIKARKSIIKLGRRAELEEQMLEVQAFVNNPANKNSFKSLFSKTSFKALCLSVGLHLVQKFSGYTAMSMYMQTIFIASGSTIPSQFCSIIVGFVQLITVSISTRIVDVFGKKPLFLLSTSGCGISLLILGAYFYLRDYNYDTSNIYWLPLFCFVLYMISFKLALAGLVRVIMGEIFPANVKSLGSSITIVFHQVTAFLIALYFPLISQQISMAYSFWFFSGCCVLSIFYIFYALPETKGKSFQEIQDILNGTKPQTTNQV